MKLDFFGKRDREGTNNTATGKESLSWGDLLLNNNATEPDKKGPVTVFRPKSFKDVESIIRSLKEKREVIVYMNELSDDTGKRVLDIISGAIFALDGGICEMETNTFFISPFGISQR